MTDHYLRGTQSYWNAARYPHKTGVAWEGFSPRPIPWGRVALVAAALLPAVGLYFGCR